MANKRPELCIKTFLHDFSGKKSISNNDLKSYFSDLHPGLTEQDYQRFLYKLLKESYLSSPGSGIYIIQDPKAPDFAKRIRFDPIMSSFLLEIKQEILSELPFANFVIWETKILHDLMVQQPGINMVILETENETTGVAFNYLSEKYPGRVFISPDRKVIENYVLPQRDTVIISKLISQTPKGRREEKLPYAKLEKILVDIFVDDNKFFIFQGSEMVSIYEEAFRVYLIDERSLFRYAGRRNAKQKLHNFIQEKTKVKLVTNQGEIL